MVAAARDRLAARAFDAGIARVSVDVTDSPLGPLWLALGPRGVVGIHFGNEPDDLDLRRIVARYGPGVLRLPRRLDAVKRQLDEYFRGRRRRFELDVDLSALTPFQRRILGVTRRVTFGEVCSYGDIAEAAGTPRAARAAGGALGSNPVCILVPCHRVVASDGTLGGYGGGLDAKRFLLGLERDEVPEGGWPPSRGPALSARLRSPRSSRLVDSRGRAKPDPRSATARRRSRP